MRPFQPGVPVHQRQICAAWPAFCFAGSAHGIQPFAALLRPDSSAMSSAAEAHLTFVCRIHLDGSGRGIGRQNSYKCRQRPTRMLRFVFWALTVRPAIHCLSSDSRLMLPWALPLSGLRTPVRAAWRARPRHRPLAVARSVSGGSPLLGFSSVLQLCRDPDGPPDQNRSRRLLFSDSSGQCLAPPAFVNHRNRTSFPYEVFNQLIRFRSLAC